MRALPPGWSTRTHSIRAHVFARRQFARVYVVDTMDSHQLVLDRELVIERGSITKTGSERLGRQIRMPLSIATKLGFQLLRTP